MLLLRRCCPRCLLLLPHLPLLRLMLRLLELVVVKLTLQLLLLQQGLVLVGLRSIPSVGRSLVLQVLVLLHVDRARLPRVPACHGCGSGEPCCACCVGHAMQGLSSGWGPVRGGVVLLLKSLPLLLLPLSERLVPHLLHPLLLSLCRRSLELLELGCLFPGCQLPRLLLQLLTLLLLLLPLLLLSVLLLVLELLVVVLVVVVRVQVHGRWRS